MKKPMKWEGSAADKKADKIGRAKMLAKVKKTTKGKGK